MCKAVNPGQFKPASSASLTNDSSMMNDDGSEYSTTIDAVNSSASLKEVGKNSTTFFGNVGINTPIPDQALTVVGNVKLTGVLLQPSDIRVKENIEPVNPNDALDNVSKLKLYKYDFKPEFVDVNGGIKSDYGMTLHVYM